MSDQWGRGVVLCVTGLSRQERQAAEDAIVLAGGSYSPTLSRRCTHLLVPPEAPASDKLASALRNQRKWGLVLVSPSWLAASAQRGARQPETAYPVMQEEGRTPLAAVPANKASAWRTGVSHASRATSVPDSCGQGPPQRSGLGDPLQRSVNSLPSRDVSPPSLLTQPAEVKHSLGTGPQALQQSAGAADAAGDARRPGAGRGEGRKGVSWASLPTAAADRFMAQPGDCADSQGEGQGWAPEHMPLTQAGFMPTDDLLEFLREQGGQADIRHSPALPGSSQQREASPKGVGPRVPAGASAAAAAGAAVQQPGVAARAAVGGGIGLKAQEVGQGMQLGHQHGTRQAEGPGLPRAGAGQATPPGGSEAWQAVEGRRQGTSAPTPAAAIEAASGGGGLAHNEAAAPQSLHPTGLQDLVARLQQAPQIDTFTPLAARSRRQRAQQAQRDGQKRALGPAQPDAGAKGCVPMQVSPAPAVLDAAALLGMLQGLSAEAEPAAPALQQPGQQQPSQQRQQQQQQLALDGSCWHGQARALGGITRPAAALGAASPAPAPVQPAPRPAAPPGLQPAEPAPQTGLELLVQQLQHAAAQNGQQHQQAQGAPVLGAAGPPAPAPATLALLDQLYASHQGQVNASGQQAGPSVSGAPDAVALLQQQLKAVLGQGQALLPTEPAAAFDSAALLQMLQADNSTTPCLADLEQSPPGQRSHPMAPAACGGSGSPMMLSPGPAPGLALARQLLASSSTIATVSGQGQMSQGQQQQAPPSAAGSPMQVSPAPPIRDPSALLGLLQASSNASGPQQQQPANRPSAQLDIAGLLGAIGGIGQQQQEQHQPTDRGGRLDTAALLQQLQGGERQQQAEQPGSGAALPPETSSVLDPQQLLRRLQAQQLWKEGHLASTERGPAIAPSQRPGQRRVRSRLGPLQLGPGADAAPGMPPSDELLQRLSMLQHASPQASCPAELRRELQRLEKGLGAAIWEAEARERAASSPGSSAVPGSSPAGAGPACAGADKTAPGGAAVAPPVGPDSPTVGETELGTPTASPTCLHSAEQQRRQQQPTSHPTLQQPSPAGQGPERSGATLPAAGPGLAAATSGQVGLEPTVLVQDPQRPLVDSRDPGAAGAPGEGLAASTPGLAQGCQGRPGATGSGSVGGGCGSAAGSAGSGADAGSQVADSERGVFGGMSAILDPELSEDEAARVARALQQGGGRVVDCARLGQGATHVVCQPEAALRWLSMGLGIVSPQWVVRSLKAGRQQRCLTLSADATRHLPVTAGGQGGGLEESLLAAESSKASALPPLAQLQSREAREAVLQQLAAAPPAEAAGAGAGPLSTPSCLLMGISWAVADPPGAAAPDRTHHPPQARLVLVRQFSPGDVIPDSEDEEEQFCFQATQAAYREALGSLGHNDLQQPSDGGSASPAAGTAGSPGRAAWLEQLPGFRGAPTLTLLLPRDGRVELGHDTRCLAAPGGCASAEQLLQHIYDYYQEAVPPEEQVSLLRSSPAAHAVAAVVKPAFVEMRPLARHQLLGARLSLEGLFKVTREPTGSIYELRLGC